MIYNKMNFKEMNKEELVALLTKVRHSLFGCEDAANAILDISEMLNVGQEVGAINEEE